jgi:hypothetical protein
MPTPSISQSRRTCIINFLTTPQRQLTHLRPAAERVLYEPCAVSFCDAAVGGASRQRPDTFSRNMPLTEE